MENYHRYRKTRLLYYKKNKEKTLFIQKERRKKRRDMLARYKLEKGCFHCGYRQNSYALDLHHLKEKNLKISAMISFSEKKIFKELAKCIVLCANCHRIETASLIGFHLERAK